MTKTILLTVLIATVFAVGTLSTNDAFASGYLKIGDIKGESTNIEHKGEIDIQSWSWGETQAGTHAGGGGGGAGKVSLQDFNFEMQYNKASPKIMESLSKGVHFDDAQLFLTAPSRIGEETTYLTITMKDVIVSSYQTGGSADQIPTEQVSLNFGSIEFKYIPLGDPDRPIITGFAAKPGHRGA